jgi:lysozyme
MPDDTSKAKKIDNSTLRMSSAAKTRMRGHEDPKYYYYDDGGRPGRGNCTWGIGTLAHRGPCTADELKTKVGPAEVEAAFASRIADAEGTVRRKVTRQALTQEQFDALVSFVYNVGERGARDTLKRLDNGDFGAAARGISESVKMRVKTEGGSKLVVARGLIQRRAEESAPFRVPAS